MIEQDNAAPPDLVPPEAAVEIGVARRDITPPVGIYARSWGRATHDVATGVHRPLTATVLVLREAPASAPLILAVIDAGWWQRSEDEWRVRGPLLERLGLDPARVMVSCTHTHAAASLCLEDRENPGGYLIAPYLDQLREALLAAAREAIERAQPGTLTWATSRCDLAAHRDLPDPGEQRSICGFNPRGDADDTLLVGRLTSSSGDVLGTLVNYACHPTTLAWDNRLLSPDFVGSLRAVVEAHTGAPCLFLQGASGELAPREQYTGDTAIADKNGRQLGYATLAAVESMLPPRTALSFAGSVASGAPLGIWERRALEPSHRLSAEQLDVELPLKPLPAASELRRELAASNDRVQSERLRRKLRIIETVGSGATCRLPAWVWRIGESFFVGHPNEAYSLLQENLRHRFPEHGVAVMNLVNGACGYLSPPELHDRDLYQVWQSPFDRDALPRLIAACGETIERMLSS